MHMSKHKIAVIAGDGIGPEVVAEALKVVDAAGVSLDTTGYELGASHYLQTGEVLPDAVLAELRSYDAIFFGAIGPPVGSASVPPGVIERGLLLRLRFELDQYINLRPATGAPGSIAADADLVIVRENTEGVYAGEGGFFRKGTPYEIATQGSINTRHGVERCVRFAFELAKNRRHNITLVHKAQALSFAGNLWQRVFAEVGEEYPGVNSAYNLVDAACVYLVEDPTRYDVIVTDNLFGDILSDLAGALTGGIGLAASANLNPERNSPSLFEPVHGAAHDIAGKGIANPIAAIRSAAMMLDHLGEKQTALSIMAAAEKVLQRLTDKEVAPGTSDIGDAIAAEVS
jgi:3-isopropylmalate dehydrogenase